MCSPSRSVTGACERGTATSQNSGDHWQRVAYPIAVDRWVIPDAVTVTGTKKFSPGALIGELSGYTAERPRTASIVADEPSVLYRLDISRTLADGHETAEVNLAVHEMVAHTLSTGLEFMNRRLLKEIS